MDRVRQSRSEEESRIPDKEEDKEKASREEGLTVETEGMKDE